MRNLKKNWHILYLAVGVVLVWRGVWGLADMFLFPNDLTLSFIVSILAGILILYLKDHKLDELK